MEPGGSCPATAPSGCRRRCRAGRYHIARVVGARSVLRLDLVDAAPWGFAPSLRSLVEVDRFLAWARGPWWSGRFTRRPSCLFGAPGVGVSISLGGPVVGSVALGWGSRSSRGGAGGFIRSRHGGAGALPARRRRHGHQQHDSGQRANINVYRNSSVRNAVVVVHEDHFGRGPITSARVAKADVTSLRPTHTAPQIATTPASFVPTASRGVRPPEGSVQRPVVATRPPHTGSEAAAGGERKVGPAGVPMPAPRLVSVPPRRESSPVPARPAFGQSTVERPTADRAQPPLPPGAPKSQPSQPQPQREPRKVTPVPTAPQPSPSRAATPPPSARRPEAPAVTAPAPVTPQPSPSRAATPPPPARRPEAPAVTAPAPTAPQPSSGRAAAPLPGPRPGAPAVTAPAPSTPAPSPSRAATPPPSPPVAPRRRSHGSGAGRGSTADPARRDTRRAHTSTARRASQSSRSEPWAGYAEILSRAMKAHPSPA